MAELNDLKDARVFVLNAIECLKNKSRSFETDENLDEKRLVNIAKRFVFFHPYEFTFEDQITNTYGCKCGYYGGHSCQDCYDYGMCSNTPTSCSCNLPTIRVCTVRKKFISIFYSKMDEKLKEAMEWASNWPKELKPLCE